MARDGFSVLHLTAELWPFARTGGLGQAVADMAGYQSHAGIDASVMMPLYRMAREHIKELEPLGEPFTVDLGGFTEEVRCWQQHGRDGAPCVLFLDHPPSFDRDGIYGEGGSDYPDNDRRFALFSRSAIEVARRLKATAGNRLVLHAHDWHTALAPVYLRVAPDAADLSDVPSVLTVHNGGFQGHYGRGTLALIGLPQSFWSIDYMEWYGRLNYLKGGLKFADMVTTVSPTHAIEMRTEVGGFGLHDVFQRLGDRFVGIRNGIDTELWDPGSDPEITGHYKPDDLRGKASCKAALQRHWKLPQRTRVPIFGMSARLVSQKGMDLIVGSETLASMDAQFVFLGAGESRYEEALTRLAARNPERIALNTAFTDRLEHRLLAGANFLLMPSLYEPCGLTQMRAQRYGALPIARRVGGLADTIIDGVTGFLFEIYTPAELDRAVRRALDVYEDQPVYLEHARAAMRLDFSWAEPVSRYVEVYHRALAAR
ncbi:MAG TPA: glycogen/starch synthase [Gemmatimonadales bacterium]|jgi:starch synthase